MSNDNEQVINKRYLLQAKLGEGGMGVVHRALDRLTGNIVALKQIQVPTKALTYVAEVLRYQKSNPIFDGAEKPFLVHLTYIQVLQAAHDPRANPLLAMVHRLLQERAAPIKDAATRRSYLENIAEHREIVWLYEVQSE